MLTNIVFLAFQGFALNVLIVLSYLPSFTLPEEMINSLANIGNYIYALDNIIPVTDIGIIVTIFLIAEGVLISYKAIQWVIKKIPGVN